MRSRRVYKVRSRLSRLALPVLENLSEALLDFTRLSDLLCCFRLVYGNTDTTSVNASPQLQTLLAYLVLHPEHSHSRRQLAAMIYPDLTESEARTRLRQNLYRPHQVFPEIEHFIISDSRTLSWNTAALYTLDVGNPAVKQGTAEQLLTDFNDA